MAARIEEPRIRVLDANGLPYVGAKLYVYSVGTTKPLAIFSDSALSAAAPNPLTSDANGYFPLTYIAASNYKLRAERVDGVLLWEFDNQDSGLPIGAGALSISAGRYLHAARLGQWVSFHRQNIAACARLAECGPCFHQLAALFELVAAPVGCFRLVRNAVGQRVLAGLMRESGLFRCPIAECGAEAVRSYVAILHAAKLHRHCH
jgi:hypothetical protein